jgi:branched-chain amino acid transport system permease protein
MIQLLPQALLSGLSVGMIYVLAASGLTLVYGIMRLLNFAHGELYMLGGYIVFFLFEESGVPYVLSLLISMVAVGFLGVALERFFFRPFREEHDPSLMIALGLLILISGAALIAFGGGERGVRSLLPGTVSILRAKVSMDRLAVMAVAAAIMGALYLFLYKTRAGRGIRAVSQDAGAAAMNGIDVDRTIALGFGLSCALAAAAGALVTPIYFVSPFVGGPIVFKALVVIAVGGMGSLLGAVIAGIILGVVESVSFMFIGGMADAIGFLLLILILLFRPRGLMGRY